MIMFGMVVNRILFGGGLILVFGKPSEMFMVCPCHLSPDFGTTSSIFEVYKIPKII